MTAVDYNVNNPEAARLLINEFNEDLPPAGQPLTDGVAVGGSGRMAYINISFSSAVSGVLSVTRTVGATTVTEKLNGGRSVDAGSLYVATIPSPAGQTINLVYSVTNGKYTVAVGAVVQNG